MTHTRARVCVHADVYVIECVHLIEYDGEGILRDTKKNRRGEDVRRVHMQQPHPRTACVAL